MDRRVVLQPRESVSDFFPLANLLQSGIGYGFHRRIYCPESVQGRIDHIDVIDNPNALHITVVYRIDVGPGAIPDKADHENKPDEEPWE